MPVPEVLQGKDPCMLMDRWGIRLQVATTILVLAAKITRDPRFTAAASGLKIISGFRSRSSQDALQAQGRPTAPFDLSTHTTCPATGVDLRVEGHMDPFGNAFDRALWFAIGETANSIGLRWGGGSPFRDGMPSDFNHFDLGPRQDAAAQAFRNQTTTELLAQGFPSEVPTGPELT